MFFSIYLVQMQMLLSYQFSTTQGHLSWKSSIGIDDALLQIHPRVTLTTASAPVQRSVIFLDANLLDQKPRPSWRLGCCAGSCSTWTSDKRPMLRARPTRGSIMLDCFWWQRH